MPAPVTRSRTALLAASLLSFAACIRANDLGYPIVDYARVPAIDRVFSISKIADGEHPFFWTGTSHLEGPFDRQGTAAVYLAFGRALGWMQFPPGRGEYRLVDVHGAGAQRSDPKTGNPADYPHGRGPQGDVVRIDNFVRCVRGGAK